jgi:hypothetical protein
MNLAKALDRRLATRRATFGALPGKLICKEPFVEVVCRPLDVSVHGIGIFTEDELPEESFDFVLLILDQTVELQKVWWRESPGDRVGFRYGFLVKEANLDLEALFVAAQGLSSLD